MQGEMEKAKPLEYYPSVKDIFKELGWQSNTKISIPAMEKKTNQPIIEPLTDQEQEEDYEVNLHISTFTSKDSSTEDTNPLQIVNVPTEQ